MMPLKARDKRSFVCTPLTDDCGMHRGEVAEGLSQAGDVLLFLDIF